MGTPIAGRSHADTEAMIGFFVNTLVLRTRLDEGVSFGQLLQSNRQMVLDAFTHQHIPFEMLVEELKPERSLSYSPIFQVLFSLQNNDQHSEAMAGLSWEPLEPAMNVVKFDLELNAVQVEGQLWLSWTRRKATNQQNSTLLRLIHFELNSWMGKLLSHLTCDRLGSAKAKSGRT